MFHRPKTGGVMLSSDKSKWIEVAACIGSDPGAIRSINDLADVLDVISQNLRASYARLAGFFYRSVRRRIRRRVRSRVFNSVRTAPRNFDLQAAIDVLRRFVTALLCPGVDSGQCAAATARPKRKRPQIDAGARTIAFENSAWLGRMTFVPSPPSRRQLCARVPHRLSPPSSCAFMSQPCRTDSPRLAITR
jgi:hypothetical protein